MRSRTRSLRVTFLATLGLAATAALLPDATLAGTVERPIPAQMVVMTQPSGSGCHGSIFAVVADHPDAAEYRVTVVRTDGSPEGSLVTFNRHERGSMQFSKLATWNPGSGKVAGLLSTGSGDGPGTADEDCVNVKSSYEARFSIKDARVVLHTANRPRPGKPAYELKTVAVPPANDGFTGKDACTVYHFVSVPVVKGAVRYRITIVDTIVGAERTRDYTLAPADFDPKPPAGSKVAPLKAGAGRLGHYLFSQTKGGYGCKHAEWKAATAIKKLTVKAERR
jgi:hypothetical protein